MICNKCGMNNLENSNFCIGCGNDLRIQNTNPVINPQVNQNYINQPVQQQPVVQPEQNTNQYTYGMPLVNNEQRKEKNNNISNLLNNKKLLIIIGISLVVLVIGVVLGVKFLNNKDPKNVEAVFNEENPIKVLKNEKYGFIDTKGKEIIDFQYDYATEFVNGKAIAVKRDENYTETYYIINTKGEKLITSTNYAGIEYLEKQDVYVVDKAIYNSNLKRITKEEIEVEYIEDGFFKYKSEDSVGIMTVDGKSIYTLPGDIYFYPTIITNAEGEYYAEINMDDKEILISLETGKELYQITDVDNQYFYDEYDGIVRVIQSEPYETIEWLYLRGGEIAYRTSEQLSDIYVEYPDVLNIQYGYNYADLGKERSFYYYDVDTKEMLTELPKDYINLDKLNDWHTVNGYEEYYCSDGYGIMSGEKVILPCEFDTYRPVSNMLYDYLKDKKSLEIVFVEKDEKVSLYNLTKKEILYTFRVSNIYSINTYENSTFIVEGSSWYDDLDDKLVYNILTGKTLEVDDDDYINVYSNYITVSDDEEVKYYNTDLELIYTIEKED